MQFHIVGDSPKVTSEPSATRRADMDVPLVVLVPCVDDDAVATKMWRSTCIRVPAIGMRKPFTKSGKRIKKICILLGDKILFSHNQNNE